MLHLIVTCSSDLLLLRYMLSVALTNILACYVLPSAKRRLYTLVFCWWSKYSSRARTGWEAQRNEPFTDQCSEAALLSCSIAPCLHSMPGKIWEGVESQQYYKPKKKLKKKKASLSDTCRMRCFIGTAGTPEEVAHPYWKVLLGCVHTWADLLSHPVQPQLVFYEAS